MVILLLVSGLRLLIISREPTTCTTCAPFCRHGLLCLRRLPPILGTSLLVWFRPGDRRPILYGRYRLPGRGRRSSSSSTPWFGLVAVRQEELRLAPLTLLGD